MAVVESPAALRRPAVERFHCTLSSTLTVVLSVLCSVVSDTAYLGDQTHLSIVL